MLDVQGRKARDAWVKRVLGVDVGPAQGSVVTADQLRELAGVWRSARQQAIANLAGFSAAFLAAEGVRADPRLARVRAEVAGLPDLLAPFDDSLAVELEAAGDGGEAAARRALSRCQAALQAAERLAWLEGFAAKATGRAFPVHSLLGQALQQVAQRLG